MRIKWKRTSVYGLTATWPDGSEWTFTRPGSAYVYCDLGIAHMSGSLGKQICYGGGFGGSTVYVSTANEFVTEVKKWLKQYRKNANYGKGE